MQVRAVEVAKAADCQVEVVWKGRTTKVSGFSVTFIPAGYDKRLMITADCGGSNGYRVRAWKWHLAQLAAETGQPLVHGRQAQVARVGRLGVERERHAARGGDEPFPVVIVGGAEGLCDRTGPRFLASLGMTAALTATGLRAGPVATRRAALLRSRRQPASQEPT